MGAESELSAMRQRADGLDLADALSRAERLGATARGLAALIGERQRASDRERLASLDQDVVATLESEAVQAAEELASTESEAASLMPQVEDLVRAEAEVDAETPRPRLGPSRVDVGVGRCGGRRGAGGAGRPEAGIREQPR